MKRIVYTRLDGGVSVVVPAPRFMERFATEAEALAAVRAKSVPADATDVEIVEEAQIPADREFRNAWRRVAGRIDVDLPAAKAIKNERVRQAKLIKARELNERETAGEDVTAEKAILRAADVSQDIDRAATVDDLKAAWPAGFRRP